jgi:hypothetical protein
MLPAASERYLGNGPTGSAWDRENWKPCRVLTTDAILKISFSWEEGGEFAEFGFCFRIKHQVRQMPILYPHWM